MLNRPKILGISMAPRKNRRLLVMVTYVVLLACLLVILILPPVGDRISPAVASLLVIALLGSTGVFSILVKPSLSGRRSGQMTSLSLTPGPRDPLDPDEREVAIRNAAHYRAFRVIKFYALVLVLLIPLSEDLIGPAISPFLTVPFVITEILLLLSMTLTLPQAIILWTEPDVPEEIKTSNA